MLFPIYGRQPIQLLNERRVRRHHQRMTTLIVKFLPNRMNLARSDAIGRDVRFAEKPT